MPWQKRAILELSLKTALVIGKVRDLYPDMFQEDFLSCQRTENTSVIQMLWYSPSPANPLCYLRAKINSHILFIQLTGLGDEQMLFWSAFFVCVSLFFFFQYACDVQAEVVGKPAKMFFESALAEMGVPPQQVRFLMPWPLAVPYSYAHWCIFSGLLSFTESCRRGWRECGQGDMVNLEWIHKHFFQTQCVIRGVEKYLYSGSSYELLKKEKKNCWKNALEGRWPMFAHSVK